MTEDDPDCEKCEELLQGYLDRDLAPEEVLTAESHLDGCDYCRRRYRFESTLRRYIKDVGERADAGGPDREAAGAARAGRSGPSCRARRREVLRVVDVAGRREVVARDEQRLAAAEALVGDVVPELARDEKRMAAARRRTRRPRAARRCRARRRRRGRSPRARGRARRRARRPRPRCRPERGEAAAERGARASLPVRARARRARRASSSCAPATTTIWSRPAARTRSSTAGRSSRCFGEPKRSAAPAASTTAASISLPRP